MKYTKSRISRMTCIALCGVGLIAQTYALKASDAIIDEGTVANVTDAIEQAVSPSAEQLAQSTEQTVPIELLPVVTDLKTLKEICKSFETQTDFTQLKTDIVKAINLVVSSPLSVADRSDELGMGMVRSIQKIQNILMVDGGDLLESHAANTPHARDYYELLPANLPADNPNKSCYQWLVQAIYTVDKCLENKLVSAEDLQAGYTSYLKSGEKTHLWICNDTVAATAESFSKLLGLMVQDATQFNPYHVTSAYQAQKSNEQKETRAERLTLASGVSSNKGELNFIVFDNYGNGECGWFGMGLPYPNALNTFYAAIEDKRLYTEGYYPQLNRRFMAVEGEVAVLKHRVGVIDKHFLETTKVDSSDPFSDHDAAREASVAHFKKCREELTLLEDGLQQKKATHQEDAPYLSEIGKEPLDDVERAEWNLKRGVWMKNHQAEFDAWNNLKIKMDAEYEQQKFVIQYNNILSKYHEDAQTLANFIAIDFTRLFPNKFLELDPLGQNHSMLYFDMVLKLNRLNVYLWMPTADPYFATHKAAAAHPNAPIALVSSWHISPTAKDVHFLLIKPENGSGHYLKLVPEWDAVGRMNAMRHEQTFGLSKMPLQVTPVSAAVPVSDTKELSIISDTQKLPTIEEGANESDDSSCVSSPG